MRGWVELAINDSYWLGAAFGAAITPILLNPDFLDADLGWRLTFALGAVMALAILLVRRNVPESPRWLAMLRPRRSTGFGEIARTMFGRGSSAS